MGTTYLNLARPPYQTNRLPGITAGTELSMSTTRMIPDVSIVASDIQLYVFGATQTCEGGTSASVGLWAGMAALINGGPGLGGKVIGFANPTLYRLANGPNYLTYFNDPQNGNNNYYGVSPNAYHAQAGYDLATGLGTPKPDLIGGLAPPGQCSPGAALSVLVKGNTVTAFVPNGAWDEPNAGVRMVPLEILSGLPGAASDVTGVTDVVNTCSVNSGANPPQVVCSGNNNNIYLINGNTGALIGPAAFRLVRRPGLKRSHCSDRKIGMEGA